MDTAEVKSMGADRSTAPLTHSGTLKLHSRGLTRPRLVAMSSMSEGATIFNQWGISGTGTRAPVTDMRSMFKSTVGPQPGTFSADGTLPP